MTLNDLFKNTTYDDTLFSAEAKSAIESRIFMKSVRGSEVPYVGLEYEYEMEGFDMKNVLTCLTSISHLLTDGLRSKASR